MKKTIEVEATYIYTIEVDEDNHIVKDYDDENELYSDLASYRFTTLPVIDDGVEILDTELIAWSHKEV